MCVYMRVGAHYSKAAYSIAIQIKDLVRCLSVRPSVQQFLRASGTRPYIHSQLKKADTVRLFLSSELLSLIKLYELLEILVYLLLEAVYLGALAAHELVVGVDLLASYLLGQRVDTRL